MTRKVRGVNSQRRGHKNSHPLTHGKDSNQCFSVIVTTTYALSYFVCTLTFAVGATVTVCRSSN